MNTSTRRLFFTLVAIIAIATVTSAHAEVSFGHTSLDGGPSSGLSGDYKRGSRFALTEPGILNMMRAYLDGYGGPQTGSQRVSMVLYADANGMPGVKLAESAPLQINAQSPGQWYEFYTSAVPLPAGNYWLVIHSEGAAGGSTPGIIRDSGSARNGANWYGNSDTFADGAASPFGNGGGGTVELLVSGVYLPASLTTFAGRATVAGTPSGGLTSNTKRGSRVTLPGPGRVLELSAYLDGKGGASGTQTLRYALYRDAGGLPSTLVVESEEVAVTAGQAPRWLSAHVPPTDLTAGNYWVVIHTGATAGIARDYGDGAANWYSNADTYSDGPSASFGSGSPGTVTLSAAAIYVPGPVLTQTLGRTTIATTPSGGLSANFMRGSQFGAINVNSAGVVTAFWAYLDGNGGGANSQQLRVVLYANYQTREIPVDKIYQSETVTIPAGMSPRWVRFPLKAPWNITQNPGYFLMLQSGDTQGVARDYGDGAANWLGLADTFADGAQEDFLEGDTGQTQGTVTLSIYAEYAVPSIGQ
jgi:hypothetical protein